MRRMVSSVVCCVGLAAMAGCGSDGSGGSGGASAGSSSSGKAVSIDVGSGKPIEAKTSTPRVAFFGAGTSNLYLRAFNAAVLAEAKRSGVKVTTFDAQFDPAKQMDQVENALQRGGFDAYLIIALDGNTMCPVLTKQAPAKGIAVVTALTPICNTGLNPEGDKLWSPGTIAHVQDDSTYTEDQKWVDAIAQRLPGKHTVALLNGPPLITVAKAFKKAIDYGKTKYPNLDFKYVVSTDQSTPDCLTKEQTLLQAHPEVDVVLSNYSDCTVGAIKAIKAAGKSAAVKVFDVGGSPQSFAAVKAGELEMTTFHTPRDNGTIGLRTLVQAFQGKKVPRYVGVYPPGVTIANSPLIIDKSNVGKYQPQR